MTEMRMVAAEIAWRSDVQDPDVLNQLIADYEERLDDILHNNLCHELQRRGKFEEFERLADSSTTTEDDLAAFFERSIPNYRKFQTDIMALAIKAVAGENLGDYLTRDKPGSAVLDFDVIEYMYQFMKGQFAAAKYTPTDREEISAIADGLLTRFKRTMADYFHVVHEISESDAKVLTQATVHHRDDWRSIYDRFQAAMEFGLQATKERFEKTTRIQFQ